MNIAKEQLFNTSIDSLVSKRLGRIMKKHGYKTIGKMLSLKSITLQKWHGIGDGSIIEFLDVKKSLKIPEEK